MSDRDQPKPISFYVSKDPEVRQQVLDGLAQIAERFGISQSELIRQIALGKLEVVIPRKERQPER